MTFQEEWERCKPWIKAALAYDEGHELRDVLNKIYANDAQFWPGKNAAIVTEVSILPRIRTLHIWLCGGDMQEMVDDMLPCLIDFAKQVGCDCMSWAGRPGWERVLRTKGFEPAWRVGVKKL